MPSLAHADGSVDIACGNCPTLTQLKTLAVSRVKFAAKPEGGGNSSAMQLDCPDCGSSTWHPIQGDGSCRAAVRDMFARTVQRLGSPDGKCPPGDYAASQAYIGTQATALNAPPVGTKTP